MKNLIILFLFILLACSKKNINSFVKSKEIVDYNNSYEFYENSFRFSSSLEKQKKQTIILFKDKQISFDRFYDLLNKKKVQSIETINDSIEISKLGYDYNNVKKILIVIKK